MKSISLCFLLALVFSGPAVFSQRSYVCYYAAVPPVIDGKGGESVWQKAPWTEDFTDIEGSIRPAPSLKTRAKLLWDSSNLYIYAEMEEPDLWGNLRQHDTIIYRDNDFEVFIDPDNDTHNYFELEINPLGTVMDLFMAKPYRNGGNALMSWDAQGLRSAVRLKGTLNRPGDKDEGWSVEMAIPLETLKRFREKNPGDSSMWRINFSRVEWDRDVVGGAYVPKTDSTGRRLPEHNWVWSPQGIIDMHAPEHWGYLLFTRHPAGSGDVVFSRPLEESVRDKCWAIYYAEQQYRRGHGKYTSDLGELGMASDAGVLLECTSLQFVATVGNMRIDQDGKIGRVR